MVRRVAGVAGIVAGLVLIVGTFAVGGFRAAAAGERLLDLSRPELTKEGAAALRRDFDNVTAAGSETQTVIVPAYAAAEGMTLLQFGPVFLARYPALAKAAGEAQSTAAFTNKAITNVEAHQKDFAPADSIPVSFLPLTVAPAITLGLGVILVVAGLLSLRPGVGRGPVVAVLVTGVVILGFTFGGGTFHKVNAAHDLISSLNITKASAVDTRNRLNVQEAGGRELSSRVLPDLQAKLHMSDEQFNTYLTTNAPHLAKIHADIDAALARFEVDARIREKGFDEFGIIRDVPIRALPWLYVASGALAVLGAGAALLVLRREDLAARPPATPEVASLAG